MILRYQRKDGTQMEFMLGERPITIGRSPEADLVILDEKASRLHCGIRLWDGDFYIKDLKSKNGTFVNDQRIDIARLNPGDRVRIGKFQFVFEVDASKGSQTILQEVADEMTSGKGYTTILKEIVKDADNVGKEAAPPAPAPEPVSPLATPPTIRLEMPVPAPKPSSEALPVVPEAEAPGEATVTEASPAPAAGTVTPAAPPSVKVTSVPPAAAGAAAPKPTFKTGLRPGLKLPPKIATPTAAPGKKFVVKIRKPGAPPAAPATSAG